jgi:hypothetical protein
MLCAGDVLLVLLCAASCLCCSCCYCVRRQGPVYERHVSTEDNASGQQIGQPAWLWRKRGSADLCKTFDVSSAT